MRLISPRLISLISLDWARGFEQWSAIELRRGGRYVGLCIAPGFGGD
jgi:hypothetical protein